MEAACSRELLQALRVSPPFVASQRAFFVTFSYTSSVKNTKQKNIEFRLIISLDGIKTPRKLTVKRLLCFCALLCQEGRSVLRHRQIEGNKSE